MLATVREVRTGWLCGGLLRGAGLRRWVWFRIGWDVGINFGGDVGSTSFVETSRTSNVADAYNELVAAAGHEHGYGAYGGTIAQSPGIVVHSVTPVSAAVAH